MSVLILDDPLEKQKEFMGKNQRIRLYSGAFGAGKSFTLCYAVVLHSIKEAPNRFLICRKRMTDLRNTTMKTFFEILPPYHPIVKQWHKSESCLYLINGSEIWFGGFDTSTKWASAELGGFAMDEATDFKEEDFLMLTSRLRKKNVKEHLGLLACNPSTKMHWIYNYFFENNEGNYGVVETTSHDNTHLPASTLERYEAWKKTNPDYYKRYIEGHWGIMEGLVYKTFDPTYNVREFKIQKSWRFYLSIDWGYENPFVCLWIGLDENDNIHIFNELYQKQLLIGDAANIIKSKHPRIEISRMLGDPSGAQNIAELKEYGLWVDQADNSVEAGIRAVMEHMPKIFVHPRCENTIKEFQSYQWQDSPSDKNKPEMPLKANDHAMDALRYFIYTHFKEVELTGLTI